MGLEDTKKDADETATQPIFSSRSLERPVRIETAVRDSPLCYRGMSVLLGPADDLGIPGALERPCPLEHFEVPSSRSSIAGALIPEHGGSSSSTKRGAGRERKSKRRNKIVGNGLEQKFTAQHASDQWGALLRCGGVRLLLPKSGLLETEKQKRWKTLSLGSILTKLQQESLSQAYSGSSACAWRLSKILGRNTCSGQRSSRSTSLFPPRPSSDFSVAKHIVLTKPKQAPTFSLVSAALSRACMNLRTLNAKINYSPHRHGKKQPKHYPRLSGVVCQTTFTPSQASPTTNHQRKQHEP